MTPHTNLQKPRPKKPTISAAEKRKLRRKMLFKRSKSQRMKVLFRSSKVNSCFMNI